MWKIFNKLFGWQYAIICYGSGDYVVKVHTAQTGFRYYKIYGGIYLLKEQAVMLTLSKQEEV
tara:strand:- start:1276 stop:1461 length:186 start_codon:yes stop_codon:yes gene_type:complete